MENTVEPTANVPSERIAELRDKIAKLNRKAEKLGCDPIVLRLGEPFTHELEGKIVEDTPVFITGKAPQLNGWQFVATLEHDENGTLIRRIPTFTDEVDLTQYRTATPDNCDQCHARRRRNDTYIVAKYLEVPQRAARGDLLNSYETKQVGSTCLKDFTGHENPEAIARWMEAVRDLIEGVKGGSLDGGYLTPRYYLGDLMAEAAVEVRLNGYVSRRQAQEDYKTATADAVRNSFFARQTPAAKTMEPVTDEDVARGDKAIEWVQSLEDKDLEQDYLYNLYTVCKSGTLTARQFGIAASAITAYERAMERKAERSGPGRVDEFIGEKGDKIDVTFTVFRVYENVTEYGMSYKHILRADTGHTLTWRTSSEPLEQGKTYTGTFSIKDHYEGKNGKETQIFRPNKKTLKEVS
jgi:hypothetical protein